MCWRQQASFDLGEEGTQTLPLSQDLPAPREQPEQTQHLLPFPSQRLRRYPEIES